MAAFHSHSSPAADLLAAAAAAAKMDAANAGNPASTPSTAAASGTATPASTAAATASARKGVRGNKRARLVCMRCHEKKIKCDLQHSTIGPDNEHPKCTRCDLAGYECRVRLSKRGSGNQAASRRASAAATLTTNTAVTSPSAATKSISRSPTAVANDNSSNRSPVESYPTTNGNGNGNSNSTVLPALSLGSYDRMGHHTRQQHAHLSHTTISAPNSRKPSLLNPANGRDAHTKRNGSMMIIAAAAAAAAGNDGFDEPSRSDSDDERRSPTSRSNGSHDSNNSRYSPTNTSASALGGSSLAAPPPQPQPQIGSGNGVITQLPPPSSMTSRNSVTGTYHAGASSFSGGLPSFPSHHTAAAAAAHRRYSEAVNYGYGHGHGHTHVHGYLNGNGYGHTHANGNGNGYGHAIHGGYSALNNGNGNGHGNDKGVGSGSGQGSMESGTGSRVTSSTSASAPSLLSTITTDAANTSSEQQQRQQRAPTLPADHSLYRSGSVSGLAGGHSTSSNNAPAYAHHHPLPAAIHPPTGYGPGSYAPGGYPHSLKNEYDEYERDDSHAAMNSQAHGQPAHGYPSNATGYYRERERGSISRKREREWDNDRDCDRDCDSADPASLLNVLNHHLPTAPHHPSHHPHGPLPPQPYHHSAYDHDRTLPPLHSTSCNPTHHPSILHHSDHHFHINTPASSQCQSACASRANSSAIPLPAASIATSAAFDLPPPILQESFIETYFEYAYTWCPVLDRAMLLTEPHILESPLLKQALALLGSRIEPPVMQHATPNQYYERATQLFHSNVEKDPVVSLQALMMLYWWGAAPAPGQVSFDTVWWWTGIAIRMAQQVGLHRELPLSAPTPSSCPPGLRRRIWWTLYARERLTSMCEGRPCIIDPADCDVKEPSVHDFPETVDLLKAQTFVSWVKLSGIVGRVAKYRSSKTENTRFPGHIARELIDWVKSLPDSLWLPIGGDRCRSNTNSSATTPGCGSGVGTGAGALSFHRDVHQLYLPYLSAITLLYLTKSSQPLAKAYQTAILSAACVARIFEDFLARRSVRFLQGLSAWHIAIAILALLHGRKIKQLTEECDRNIALLRIALKEVGKSWSSARLFDAGFERVIRSDMFAVPVAPMTPPLQPQPQQHTVSSLLAPQQQSIPPIHMTAQVSPTSVTPPAAADRSEMDIDQDNKQNKDEESKDKQEDERHNTDADAKSISSLAEKGASPKESSANLPNPSPSPKHDASSVTSDSKVQATAASTPAITTGASVTTATMTVPTITSTAIHTPISSNQITLQPMALHPHLRPPRPGCNSSLSELADVATGTLINWLDFFPFATRETSPLVDVLLQTSRAGLLEFDAVDWPVGDMSRMLNDLLYY